MVVKVNLGERKRIYKLKKTQSAARGEQNTQEKKKSNCPKRQSYDRRWASNELEKAD